MACQRDSVRASRGFGRMVTPRHRSHTLYQTHWEIRRLYFSNGNRRPSPTLARGGAAIGRRPSLFSRWLRCVWIYRHRFLESSNENVNLFREGGAEYSDRTVGVPRRAGHRRSGPHGTVPEDLRIVLVEPFGSVT